MGVENGKWLEAQHSVLGAALIEPKVIPRILAELSDLDFSGPCLSVFNAISECFNSGFPVDVVSVAAKLGEEYRQFLADLMQITPSAANVDRYIILCREQARVLACRETGKDLAQCQSIEDALHLVESVSLLLCSSRGKQAVNMQDSLLRFFEKPEKQIRYLSWPLEYLNSLLYVGDGKFMILGAEPSVGKTAFALQCAWHWASAKKVGFFSFETDPETLFDRLISMCVGIPMQHIKTNQITRREWDAVIQANAEITRRKLDLIPAAGMTVADMRAKIMEAGYQVIIVDYLQIVAAKGGSRYEQVTNVSIDLHTLAQSMGVTVLALAQLSRPDSDDRDPRNSDLRESGQIEQDADVIMMLRLDKRSRPEGPRRLLITKNKEGQLAQSILTFDGRYQRFAKGGPLDSAVAEAQDLKQKIKGSSAPPPPTGPVAGQFSMLSTDTEVPFKD